MLPALLAPGEFGNSPRGPLRPWHRPPLLSAQGDAEVAVSIVETSAVTFEPPQDIDLSVEAQQEEFLSNVQTTTCTGREAAGIKYNV